MENKISKLLAVIIATLMICAIIPAGIFTVSAKDYTPEELYTYNLWGDNAEIIGVTDKFTGGDIVLPTTIGGKTVTSISYRAFENQKGITSVTIPGNIQIGLNAFSGCTGLTSVTIGNSVTSYIAAYAFAGCTGLENITVESGNPVYHSENNCLICTEDKVLVLGCKTSIIPDDGSVTSIGSYAFKGCAGLTSITIPDSVTSINDFAFHGCAGLTSITTPDSVTYIGSYAFKGCAGLTSITIPDSVTYIGPYAFEGCAGLKSITIPNGVKNIYYNTFMDCTNLKSVKLSDNTESLDPYSFENCTALESINIPDSVTEIVYGTFNGCENLTEIGLPKSVTAISVDDVPDAFEGCNKITDVYYAGNENEKSSIAIKKDSNLLKATWHYNSKLSEKENTSEDQQTKSDSDNIDYQTDKGIKISGDNAFKEGTVVIAKRLTQSILYNEAAKAMAGVADKYQVFEFSAALNGTAVQPSGKVTVTFDLPAGYSANKLALFYIKDGKIAEQIKISIDKSKKTVTAELDHFSTYVLAEVTSSKTGDYSRSEELSDSHYGIYAIFTGLLLAAFTVLYTNKKVCNK